MGTAGSRAAEHRSQRAAPWRRSRLTAAVGQAALMALLFYAYRTGRHLADGHPAAALRQARSVWHAERLLHLPSEAALQRAALHWDGWVRVADVYYVGWALLVAWGIIRYGTGRARWTAVAYPVATTSVVVLTANHYWLDGIVGAVVVIVSVALSGRVERIVSRRGAQGA